MTPRFGAIIRNGKPLILAPEGWRRHLEQFPEGTHLWMTAQKARKTRTPPQNRYLWAVPYKMISEATGYTVDEVHIEMKALFGVKEPSRFNPDIMVPKSTTQYTTEEMNEYYEHLQQFGAETLEIYIPDPNEEVKVI